MLAFLARLWMTYQAWRWHPIRDRAPEYQELIDCAVTKARISRSSNGRTRHFDCRDRGSNP